MDYALATHQNTLHFRQATKLRINPKSETNPKFKCSNFKTLLFCTCLKYLYLQNTRTCLSQESNGIQATSNNETDNNFYTPYIQPILSPGDYLRPAATSFLQMTNICRLLKCKNPISETYNFGFSQLLFVGLCGPENEKTTETPPVRKQKCSPVAYQGHTLHRAQAVPILLIPDYLP